MKIKSLRHQLVSTTSIIIMTVIVVFSLILLLYMGYYLLIIGRIYAMDEDLITPIASIVAVIFLILIIVALITSIACGFMISNVFYKLLINLQRVLNKLKMRA